MATRPLAIPAYYCITRREGESEIEKAGGRYVYIYAEGRRSEPSGADGRCTPLALLLGSPVRACEATTSTFSSASSFSLSLLLYTPPLFLSLSLFFTGRSVYEARAVLAVVSRERSVQRVCGEARARLQQRVQQRGYLYIHTRRERYDAAASSSTSASGYTDAAPAATPIVLAPRCTVFFFCINNICNGSLVVYVRGDDDDELCNWWCCCLYMYIQCAT